MTQKQATRKSTKSVQIIARVQFKADPRKVCYIVRSSDGESQYTTCLFDGKACSCSCASRKPCYHMDGAEQKEAQLQRFQAEAMALAEERKAEAKLTAFKRGMEEQYASDPRESLKEREARETAESTMRMFYSPW